MRLVYVHVCSCACMYACITVCVMCVHCMCMCHVCVCVSCMCPSSERLLELYNSNLKVDFLINQLESSACQCVWTLLSGMPHGNHAQHSGELLTLIISKWIFKMSNNGIMQLSIFIYTFSHYNCIITKHFNEFLFNLSKYTLVTERW